MSKKQESHDHVMAALEKLTPANPTLAFTTTLPENMHLNLALGISEQRNNELEYQMHKHIRQLSNMPDNGMFSQDIIALTSYIAKTPQELAYLAYQVAAKADGKDRNPDSANRAEGAVDMLRQLLQLRKEIVDTIEAKTGRRPDEVNDPILDKLINEEEKSKRYRYVTKKIHEAIEAIREYQQHEARKEHHHES